MMDWDKDADTEKHVNKFKKHRDCEKYSILSNFFLHINIL